MRNIFDIIGKLSKEEKRHFKLYLNRVQAGGGKHKAVQLFDKINEGKVANEEELGEMFYAGNKNAYYRLKNRLLNDLEKSLLLLHGNLNHRVEIMERLCVAEIFRHKLLYKEAFDILKKIERQAAKGEHYDLLAIIYSEIIKLGYYYEGIKVERYLEKQTENQQKHARRLQLDQLMQNVIHRLTKSNYEIRDHSLETDLNELREQLNIEKELVESKKIQFDISNMVRRILLQKKDFKALETYLVTNYKDFEERDLYDKTTHVNKIISLVWIFNTLLKNCKFEKLPHYTNLLHDALIAYNKLHFAQFEWTYYQCLVTQHFYNNEISEAIVLLKKLLDEQPLQRGLYHEMFVYCNLAVLYYCKGKLDKAMTSLAPMFYKETYNKLSVELKLRLSILEIILHYENGDFNFLEYRLEEVKKTFRRLLKQPDYEHDKRFIKLLHKSLNLANPFQNSNFIRFSQQFVEQSPQFSPGSNEFISYRLWVQSKLRRTDYFSFLLKSV